MMKRLARVLFLFVAAALQAAESPASEMPPLDRIPLARLKQAVKPFHGHDPDRGATAYRSADGFAELHPPWQQDGGVLIIVMPPGRDVEFQVRGPSGDSDGVGISLFLESDGELLPRTREVALGDGPLLLKDAASGSDAPDARFWIVVDANRTTFADAFALSGLARAAEAATMTLGNDRLAALLAPDLLLNAPDGALKLQELPFEQLRELAMPFTERDPERGAVARRGGSGFSEVHVPWQKDGGLLVLEIPPGPELHFTVRTGSGDGDGVGVSAFRIRDGVMVPLGRGLVPPDRTSHAYRAGTPEDWRESDRCWIVIDENGNSFADTVVIENLPAAGAAVTMTISKDALTALELATARPDPAPVMEPHLSGRTPGVNVYSARDSRRPMIAAHVYFTEEAKARLAALTDVFDYITQDGGGAAERLCELAAVPWVGVYHNALPVNAYDTPRLESVEALGAAVAGAGRRYAFRLGVTSGSEPHFSPDCHYTGHNPEEIAALLTSPGGARDFGEWLQALYGDDAPDRDSNGDGVSFLGDFGFSAPEWHALGPAVPPDSPDYQFLLTLFKEHVTAGTIATVDRSLRRNPALAVTARLLSPQYPATFGQSLRQLRIPELAVGVTYYNHRSHALDPAATQVMFDPARLYSSEKTYTAAYELRPPFWQSSGDCYGIFGPFAAPGTLSFRLKGAFSAPDARLAFRLFALLADGRSLPLCEQEVTPGFERDFHFDLPPECTRVEFRLSSPAPERMDNSVKALLIAPELTSEGVRIDLASIEEYRRADTGYILSKTPEERVDIGHRLATYSPEITEFRGAYVYEQGRRHGARPVYNEFMPGNVAGNTPDNVWRAVFHELQFRPAAMVWFCYAGGSPEGAFSWMDCHYLATELAVLRGQLEMLNVYGRIRRDRRELAIFLPSAAPEPLSGMSEAGQKLGDLLTPFGPDVLLLDQFDRAAEYRNIIVMPGFLDGKSDRAWQELLKNPAPDQRILIVPGTPFSYCEPGRRGSADFRHALDEVLPLALDEAVQTGSGSVDAVSLSGSWYRSRALPGVQSFGDPDSPLAARRGNVLMLAGIPDTGLAELVEAFFGLPIPDRRSAGDLHLLNRSARAATPGLYCLDAGQELTIPAEFPAFDLVRSRPVNAAAITGPGVVAVLAPDKLQLLESGTARARVLSDTETAATVELFRPRYAFEGEAAPAVLLYAPDPPRVEAEGEVLQAEVLGNGFYRVPVDRDGLYRFSR